MRLSEIERISIRKNSGDYWTSQRQRQVASMVNQPVQGFKSIAITDPDTGQRRDVGVYYVSKYQSLSLNSSTFMILDPMDNQLIGFVAGNPTYDILQEPIWQIESTGVAKKFSGQKLGLALYTGLVRLAGFNLMAGTEQSIGGRKLWKNLAQQPGITVWAFDFWESPVEFFPVDSASSGSELRILIQGKSKPLYEKHYRLLAVANSGPLLRKIKKHMVRWGQSSSSEA